MEQNNIHPIFENILQSHGIIPKPIKDAMSPTPWHLEGDMIKHGESYIMCHQVAMGPIQRQANAEAIVTAVNNTYGSGISPAAVAELYRTLKNMCEYFEWLIKDPNFPAYREAKAAIEKATIK